MEEQFGPVVPIVAYDSLDSVLTYAKEGKYGQQVSIFTSANNKADQDGVARLVDRFSTVFGKININYFVDIIHAIQAVKLTRPGFGPVHVLG